jgi:hypothetical protein
MNNENMHNKKNEEEKATYYKQVEKKKERIFKTGQGSIHCA